MLSPNHESKMIPEVFVVCGGCTEHPIVVSTFACDLTAYMKALSSGRAPLGLSGHPEFRNRGRPHCFLPGRRKLGNPAVRYAVSAIDRIRGPGSGAEYRVN